VFRTLPTALAPLLLTIACSHHGSPPAAQPAPPPLQVVAVDPSPGQIGVAQRGQVSVTFAEDLAGQTDTDFEVLDALGPLAGLRTYDQPSHRWTWTPLFELPRGATLRAVLAAGLQGQSGTALAAPYEWTFLVHEGTAAQPQDLTQVPPGSHVFAVAARTGVGALACGETVYESVASLWQASTPAAGLGSISGFVADGVGQLAVLSESSGPQVSPSTWHGDRCRAGGT
jgi:hypothetical protein